jgi:hypothetical protein
MEIEQARSLVVLTTCKYIVELVADPATKSTNHLWIQLGLKYFEYILTDEKHGNTLVELFINCGGFTAFKPILTIGCKPQTIPYIEQALLLINKFMESQQHPITKIKYCSRGILSQMIIDEGVVHGLVLLAQISYKTQNYLSFAKLFNVSPVRRKTVHSSSGVAPSER